jgi:hypothetical protein
MGQPKDEIYCITDDQGRSARVNNGIVEFVSTITPLRVSPDGWQEKSIKYARNITNCGMWRTFTNPLKYVKDAALIVRDQFYRYGTERKLYQVIHRLDKTFLGGWIHKFFYRGELDLSQTEDSDTAVTVNIMEGDLIKLFKANENTVYELDIDVPDAVNVKMDGTFLKGSKRFVVIDPEYAHGIGTDHKEMMPMQGSEAGEGYNFNIFFKSEAASLTDANYSFIQGEDLSTSDKYNGRTDKDINVSFHMEGSIIKDNFGIYGNRLGFDVILETNTGRVFTLFNLSHVFADNFLDAVPWKFSVDSTEITLLAGEKFFIYQTATSFQSNNAWHYGDDVLFDYKTLDRYKITYTNGLRPAYVAQKLLDKITGGGYTFTSTYLTTVWENLLITSGDAIRGIPGAKLKISWADFYESYNVPCNLCEGIRNQILFIEKKEDAFQPTIQQAMGEVKDLRVSTAKDFQYNVLKIGYPNTDTEDVNGRDEFNVTQTYTSPITRVNKSLDLISKVWASMFEIEIVRVKFVGKATTDDESDNRSFFLHVEKTATTGTGDEPAVYYKLLRNTYTSVSGLISPATAFNLELHPELCLYRHGNYLRGIFYWETAGNLVFQTSDKNGNVVVINNGQTYIGNKNINIGSLAAPLFVPLVFKVEGPMPLNFIDVMDAGPDGTFSFIYNDELYYGFPLECGIQPANRPAQETTLLCSPVTNLNQLISMSR